MLPGFDCVAFFHVGIQCVICVATTDFCCFTTSARTEHPVLPPVVGNLKMTYTCRQETFISLASLEFSDHLLSFCIHTHTHTHTHTSLSLSSAAPGQLRRGNPANVVNPNAGSQRNPPPCPETNCKVSSNLAVEMVMQTYM